MARTRLLHPDFFLHDGLGQLPPIHRILFAGLWPIADRDGRLDDKPLRIKLSTLPYDNCDVDQMLNDLARGGHIVRYEVDGRRYIAIPSWSRWQNPHIKEKQSVIPGPGSSGASTVLVPVEHETSRAIRSCSNSVSNSVPPAPDNPGLEPVGIASATGFKAVKAHWLAAYQRELKQPYPWDVEDAKKLNAVLEAGLAQADVCQRIDRFFRDPWCRERADFSLFRTKFKGLVDTPAQRRPDPVEAPLARARGTCAPWETALVKLREGLPTETFERWVAPLQARIVGTELVLRTPEEWHAEFLRDNGYADLIAKACGEVGEWTIRIEGPGNGVSAGVA